MLPAPADLTLDEKCRLLGGASTWRSHPIERLGIPAVKMSDGPNGVRGDGLGARRTPGALEDTPAWRWYAPTDGVQRYGDGVLMGYRGFDAAGTEPLFPFGYGLSYGAAEWGVASLSSAAIDGGRGAELTVPVRAVGERAATVVVQAYLSGPDGFDRPPKVLAGFTRSVVAAGEEEAVVVTIPPDAFRRWDGGGWVVDEGTWVAEGDT